MKPLVFSKLCYWSKVWCNTIEPNLNKVQDVKTNFACRIISGAKKYAHKTVILKKLDSYQL